MEQSVPVNMILLCYSHRMYVPLRSISREIHLKKWHRYFVCQAPMKHHYVKIPRKIFFRSGCKKKDELKGIYEPGATAELNERMPRAMTVFNSLRSSKICIGT